MAREQKIDENDAAQSFTMQALAGIAGAKPKTMASPIIEPVSKAPLKADKPVSATKPKSAKPKAKAGTQPKNRVKDKTKADTFVVRRPGRKRTGRNFPFNQTVTPQTAQAFYDVQEELGVPMGEVLERAVAALQKRLNRKK